MWKKGRECGTERMKERERAREGRMNKRAVSHAYGKMHDDNEIKCKCKVV